MWQRAALAALIAGAMVAGWPALSGQSENARREARAWELVGYLDAHGPDTFDQVLWELHELGESAAPALISLTRDDCSSTSTYAGIVLDTLEARGIPHYIGALDNDNPRIRSAAALRLTVLGMGGADVDESVQVAQSALPRLLELMDDEDIGVAEHAGSAVEYLVGPADNEIIPVLLDALRRQSERFARRPRFSGTLFHYSPAYALAAIGPEALPALQEALRDPRQEVREAAMEGLRRMGPEAAPAIPDLVALIREQVRHGVPQPPGSEGEQQVLALNDTPPGIPLLFGASRALGAMGEAAAPAVPALLEWLQGEQVPRRWQAVDALGRIGPGAQDAVPVLVNALADDDLDLRASEALGRIGAGAVPALLSALDSGSTAGGALRALGLMGDEAQAAAGRVQAVFEGSEGKIRCEAAAALWRMGHDVGPALVVLADDCPKFREPLRNPGQGAVEAVPELFRRLVETPSRSDLSFALAKLGDAAVPVLVDGLMHEDPEVRQQAAWALQNTKGDLQPAMTRLARLLQDPEEEVRRNAVYALRRAGSAAAPILPHLAEALMLEDDRLRQGELLHLICRIPGGVDAALPAVERAYRDGNFTTRLLAERMLQQLDPPGQ